MSRQHIVGIGIDEWLMTRRSDGTTYWYLQNGLGSVMAVTAGDGVLIETVEYDVYGAPTVVQHNGALPTNNRFLFTGREYDYETELYWYRARHYHPILGRFLQRDPLEFLTEQYGYVEANPVVGVDPGGLIMCVKFPEQKKKDIFKRQFLHLLEGCSGVRYKLSIEEGCCPPGYMVLLYEAEGRSMLGKGGTAASHLIRDLIGSIMGDARRIKYNIYGTKSPIPFGRFTKGHQDIYLLDFIGKGWTYAPVPLISKSAQRMIKRNKKWKDYISELPTKCEFLLHEIAEQYIGQSPLAMLYYSPAWEKERQRYHRLIEQGTKAGQVEAQRIVDRVKMSIAQATEKQLYNWAHGGALVLQNQFRSCLGQRLTASWTHGQAMIYKEGNVNIFSTKFIKTPEGPHLPSYGLMK